MSLKYNLLIINPCSSHNPILHLQLKFVRLLSSQAFDGLSYQRLWYHLVKIQGTGDILVIHKRN